MSLKLLVDAQLPAQLSRSLREWGFDVLHTLDLPLKNLTDDQSIIDLCDREGRIVITKDKDFLRSHVLKGAPQKLLLITTGNISNKHLVGLIHQTLPELVRAFQNSNFVEITRGQVVVRM